MAEQMQTLSVMMLTVLFSHDGTHNTLNKPKLSGHYNQFKNMISMAVFNQFLQALHAFDFKFSGILKQEMC